MALKDWKKVGTNTWRKDIGNSKDIQIYINKPFYQGNGKYQLIRDNLDSNHTDDYGHIIKYFKTKQAALKFAKAYMRKN